MGVDWMSSVPGGNLTWLLQQEQSIMAAASTEFDRF